jgi:hypothetical protein
VLLGYYLTDPELKEEEEEEEDEEKVDGFDRRQQ